MTLENYVKCFTFTLLFGLLTGVSFASADLPKGALSYPVLVVLEDGSTASGFYLTDKSNYYFVTARHVVFNEPQFTLRSKTITLTSYSDEIENPKKIEIKMNFDALLKDNLVRYHKAHDVAVVYMGIVEKLDGGKTRNVFSTKYIQLQNNSEGNMCSANTLWIKMFSQVLVGNEAFIFGYPRSLGIKEIQQIDYERPLLRKGIIAGKNIHNKTIILDCPVYYGNSGGPVIQVDQEGLSKTFLPIGVVSQFVPFVEEWENKNLRYSNITISNSGYSVVVPMDVVLELLWK